jgi:hypothetical protein
VRRKMATFQVIYFRIYIRIYTVEHVGTPLLIYVILANRRLLVQIYIAAKRDASLHAYVSIEELILCIYTRVRFSVGR